MSKKLIKHGNSLALIIDKPILNMLKINEKTNLELIVENGNLIIKAVKKNKSHIKDKELEKLAEKIMDRYDDVFRKLAKI